VGEVKEMGACQRRVGAGGVGESALGACAIWTASLKARYKPSAVEDRMTDSIEPSMRRPGELYVHIEEAVLGG